MIDVREPSNNIGRKFVGINTFKVVNINPDKTALEKMKMNSDNFKGYVTEGKNGKLATINVWLSREQDQVFAKATFFINEKPLTDKSGTKHIWVDKYGVCTIYLTEEEMKSRSYKTQNFNKTQEFNWFDVDSARPAYGDEEQIYAFLRGWLGLGRGEKKDGTIIPAKECRLTIAKLLAGDFSEIQGIQSQKEVIVPLGVKPWEDKFQYQVYTKAFSGGFGRALCSAFTRGTEEEKLVQLQARFLKMADIINEASQKGFLGDLNLGAYPYIWQPFEATGKHELKPANQVSDDLPF